MAGAVWRGLMVLFLVAFLVSCSSALDQENFSHTDSSGVESENSGAVGEPRWCESADVKVFARTDQTVYAADAVPKIWLTVVNLSGSECRLNAGTDVQRYVIESGPRHQPHAVWSSEDCQVDEMPITVSLEPREERSTAPILWNKHSSAPANCSSGAMSASSTLPASDYCLSAEIGGFRSDNLARIVLLPSGANSLSMDSANTRDVEEFCPQML